jgi:predicted RNA-binding protein YlqC (UPF0109 family)
MMPIEDVLVGIVRLMVAKPDEVRVTVSQAEEMTIFVLYVDPDDRGKVIGKQGRTADALRTLMITWTGMAHIRYIFEIVQ